MKDPAENLTAWERRSLFSEQQKQHVHQMRLARGKKSRGKEGTRRMVNTTSIGERLEDELISPSTQNPYAVTAARESADLIFASHDGSPQRAHVAMFVGLFALAASDGVEPVLTPFEERQLRY